MAESGDFSISLPCCALPTSPPSVAGVFDEVETRKRSFQKKASQVASLGATICPLVLEAYGGGWSQALQGVVAWISSEPRTDQIASRNVHGPAGIFCPSSDLSATIHVPSSHTFFAACAIPRIPSVIVSVLQIRLVQAHPRFHEQSLSQLLTHSPSHSPLFLLCSLWSRTSVCSMSICVTIVTFPLRGQGSICLFGHKVPRLRPPLSGSHSISLTFDTLFASL